jgi:hypothetical protein
LAAADLLAGSWGFAIFMLACAVFGAVDAAAEPSALSALFFLSQVPFALGSILLAQASYPEAINRATALGQV